MTHDEFDIDALEKADDLHFEQMKRLKEARFRFGLRGALALVALLVGGYFVYLSMGEVGYYFKKGEQPVDLGDLRSPQFDPSSLDSLQTNDYVKFSNDAIMFDELQSEEYSFYYSPITHFVVRTRQEMPDKEELRLRDSIVELDPWEVSMVAGKKAFTWDLKVSLAGEGRLINMNDAPEWAASIAKFMANSSGVPVTKLRIFLDGEAPESYNVFFYLILAAGLLVLVTVAFFFDAAIRLARIRKNAGPMEW